MTNEVNRKVLIDGMNVAYRSYHVYDKLQGLSKKDGSNTGTIYGFVRHLVKLNDRFDRAEYYVAWEGDNSHERRKNIYSDYKGNRSSKKGSNSFFPQIEVIKNFLENLGVHQIQKEDYEADDMIATLCGEFSDDNVVIVTSDRDLLQLVGYKTVLMTPKKEEFYDNDKILDEYGVPPENYLSYKVFDGDDSDNLPGMYRFPRKKIATIVNDHDGDLDAIYEDDDMIENLTDFQEETLLGFEDQAYINKKVMSLCELEEYDLHDGNFNEDEIKNICQSLEFGQEITDNLLEFHNSVGFKKVGNNGDSLHSTS